MENLEYFKQTAQLIVSENEANEEMGFLALTNCEDIETVINAVIYESYLKGDANVVSKLQSVCNTYQEKVNRFISTMIRNEDFIQQYADKISIDVKCTFISYGYSLATLHIGGLFKIFINGSTDNKTLEVEYKLYNNECSIDDLITKMGTQLAQLERCKSVDVFDFFLSLDDNYTQFKYWKSISAVASKIYNYMCKNSYEIKELALRARFETILKDGVELGDPKLRVNKQCTYCKVISVNNEKQTAHILYNKSKYYRYSLLLDTKEVKNQSFEQLFKKVRHLL